MERRACQKRSLTASRDVGFMGDKPSMNLTEAVMKEYSQRAYEELGRVQIKAMEACCGSTSRLPERAIYYLRTVLDVVNRGATRSIMRSWCVKSSLLSASISKAPFRDAQRERPGARLRSSRARVTFFLWEAPLPPGNSLCYRYNIACIRSIFC